MLLNDDLKQAPMPGIKPKLTIPASIKAMAATKKGKVSLVVRLTNQTRRPRITKVVTKAAGLTILLAEQLPFRIKLNQPPDKIAINNRMKNE